MLRAARASSRLVAATTRSHSTRPPTPPSEPPRNNLDELKTRLLELSNTTALKLRTRADDFTETTRTTFSQLGAQLNKVTGYGEIEALKRQVVEQGACAPRPRMRAE